MEYPIFNNDTLTPIINLFKRLSGIPLSVRIKNHGLTATLHSLNCELALTSDGHGTVMVNRIQVPLPCRGQGSIVLTELTHLTGVSRIVIRNTSTPEAIRFCHRHGFHPMLCSCRLLDGELIGNYELILSDLATPPSGDHSLN